MGMNTMIFSQSGGSAGIGFAVPSSIVERLVPQIIRDGVAASGYWHLRGARGVGHPFGYGGRHCG